jgi:hypothetical protein
MSLRIILKPDQISKWITDHNGTPARRQNSETDLRIQFSETGGEYKPVSIDDLLDAMKIHHLVMLVDQEPGKTFHKIYAHS